MTISQSRESGLNIVCVCEVCLLLVLPVATGSNGFNRKITLCNRVSHLSASNIDGLSTYEISFGS